MSPYTYKVLGVQAVVTKAWGRTYSRDREVGRKRVFWRLVAYKGGHEVRRRFDRLREAQEWIYEFACSDEDAADAARWSSES